jgi:hypothetical protein
MCVGGNGSVELAAFSKGIENSLLHTAHSHAIGELLGRYTGSSQRLSATGCDIDTTFKTKCSGRDCLARSFPFSVMNLIVVGWHWSLRRGCPVDSKNLSGDEFSTGRADPRLNQVGCKPLVQIQQHGSARGALIRGDFAASGA